MEILFWPRARSDHRHRRAQAGSLDTKGAITMNEIDELVSRPGVLMAGRLGPDGRIAEHKETGLYVACPSAMQTAT